MVDKRDDDGVERVSEHFKIIRPSYIRNQRIERMLIEDKREKMLDGMLLIGAVLLLIAILY
jgi:hypothetical protein